MLTSDYHNIFEFMTLHQIQSKKYHIQFLRMFIIQQRLSHTEGPIWILNYKIYLSNGI